MRAVTAQSGPAAAGYALLAPPGWRRLPVARGSGAAIAAIVGEVRAQLEPGRERPGWPRQQAVLEEQLGELVRQARQLAVLDVYLPVEPVHGVAVAAAITVCRGTLDAAGFSAWRGTLAGAADPAAGARAVTVDGAQSVRLEHTGGPGPAAAAACGSVRVDYVMPVPGHAVDWLIVTFAVAVPGGDAGGQLAVSLTGLFDAVMATFRWVWGDQQL